MACQYEVHSGVREMFMFIILFLYIILSTISLRILDTGILPLEKNSVGLQFFIDIENDNKSNSCRIHSWPKMCCLFNTEDVECDIMNIFDNNRLFLRSADRDTLLYVHPTLLPYDLSGYCTFVIDSKCGQRNRRKKELMTIHFDTKIRKKPDYLVKKYTTNEKIENCDGIDQDTLNDCRPVNCDFRYSGQRPFYDAQATKCTKAPACYTDLEKELPDVVYEPISNRCKDLDNSFSFADIYSLAAGVGIVTESPVKTALKALLKSNCSTISENLFFLKDMFYGKINLIKGLKCDFSDACNAALISIVVCIVTLSMLLLIFVCCITVVWWVLKYWMRADKQDRHIHRHNMPPYISSECLHMRTDRNVKNRLLKDMIELPFEFRHKLSVCESLHRKMKGMRTRFVDGDVNCHCYWRDSDDTDTTSELQADVNSRLIK